MARRFNIIDGPSKWDFMLSLFDDAKAPRAIVFAIIEESPKNWLFSMQLPFLCSVRGVGRTGEEENWLFTVESTKDRKNISLKGEFSTRTRKGWMELED